MTRTLHLMSIAFLALALGCGVQSNQTTKPLEKEDSAAADSQKLDTPRSFVKNYGRQDNNPLFVFIGEKIKVEDLPYKPGDMDNGFIARYAILEKVFGDFPPDTIEFYGYDHYGTPPFSKFKNVLLYVSADSGTYYHQKYLYNDVYRAKNGRWAGSYASQDYEHENNKKTKIKPVKINFADIVYYPLKVINENGKTIGFNFPEPYFKTKGDSAIAIYGNYVEDLFILKRDGYLTARGIFKNGKLSQPMQ